MTINPAGPGAPRSFVRLHVQGSVVTRNLLGPTVRINGYVVPARYGENLLEVHPGRNEITASARWMLEYGQAAYAVDVPPGGVVDVWYSLPLTQFQRGAMGPVKQKTGGLLALLSILGFAVLLVLLLVVLALVS